MDEITNDQLMLFDTRKKLSLPVSDNSLDEIGSDLLSQDFMKAASDNVLTRNGRTLHGESNYADPLLIMNNDLSEQQHITLDDVADLDLASLSQSLVTTDIAPQLPQESLGFNDFLSENSFCLNGLAPKLNETPNKLSFDNFENMPSVEERGSKEFKIVPHYVDGKLTNTLQLAPMDSENDGPQERTIQIFPSMPAPDLSLAASADPNERVTATIEDFPSITSLTPGLNLPPNLSEPVGGETEKPNQTQKETRKLKRKKMAKVVLGGRKKKAKKTSNGTVAGVQSNTTPSSVESKEPVKSVLPRFKIVHKPDDVTITVAVNAEPQQAPPVTTTPNTFSVGPMLSLPTTALSSTPTIALAHNFNGQQPVDLILPLVSVRSEGSDKPVLKPISELKPEDVCTVRRDPLKKLSKIQLQQIVNYLKQRKMEKISSSGPGRNESSKIICKIMYPDEFLGKNQTTKPIPEASTAFTLPRVEEIAAVNTDESSLKLKKVKTRTKEPHYNEEEEYLPEIPIAPSITRSGRTSRPPKKLVKLKGTTTATSDGNVEESTVVNGTPPLPVESNGDVDKPQLVDGLPAVRKKKGKGTLKYCCPTCGKSYMTNKVFLDHLTKFPLHAESEFTMKIQTEVENESKKAIALDRKKKKCKCKCKTPELCKARRFHLKELIDLASEKDFISACSTRFAKSTSLWDFFLLRIKTIYKFEDYVKALLSELGKLVESLKLISAKILYPSHQTESTVEIQDETICQLMGVTKGTYQTYPAELDIKESRLDASSEMFFDKIPTSNYQPPELDGLGHPPDGKEDISQSSILSDILCDKSGMDTVDQLVSERLKTLAPNDDIIMDPPSDDLMNSLLDSVNAQSLSDAMFHSRVSGSTEDLLKALETLSSDIQQNHPPPALDFTALSNEFSVPER